MTQIHNSHDPFTFFANIKWRHSYAIDLMRRAWRSCVLTRAMTSPEPSSSAARRRSCPRDGAAEPEGLAVVLGGVRGERRGGDRAPAAVQPHVDGLDVRRRDRNAHVCCVLCLNSLFSVIRQNI